MSGERSVSRLAERACLPTGSFAREFRSVTGIEPVALMLRLDELAPG